MAEPTAGAIYDLGYQRYTGARLGRLYAMRTLVGYSFAAAFGSGRGEKAKRMPVLIVALAFIPAIGQVMMASATGVPGMIQYATYLQLTALTVALFAASQAPELIVTDKQHGVLSLYLSRPILASDYALAKLLAMACAMLVITLGPQLLLLAGKLLVSDNLWQAVKLERTRIFPILGGAILTSAFMASIGLTLASFSARRGYATASVIAFFLLLPAAVEMLRSVTTGSVKRYAVLFHPIYLINGFANWLFDIEAKRHTAIGRAELPGQAYLFVMLAVTVACTIVFVRRYRRVDF